MSGENTTEGGSEKTIGEIQRDIGTLVKGVAMANDFDNQGDAVPYNGGPYLDNIVRYMENHNVSLAQVNEAFGDRYPPLAATIRAHMEKESQITSDEMKGFMGAARQAANECGISIGEMKIGDILSNVSYDDIRSQDMEAVQRVAGCQKNAQAPSK